ncbi:uncharacterized protein [Drosophila kikkawai]|uniref:Uncharacterized protein n=1 Tax=Drosophila kikkawai TaxID=30033 RepID=A0ABM4GDN2_DROKI
MDSRCLLARVFLGVLLMHSCEAARKWDYEPMSLSSTTTDPSKILIKTKIDRIGRGEFAISATAMFNYTTTEETMVECLVYRSSSGAEADYKLLPWAIPRQTFHEHLNTYYKEVTMRVFKKCSNFPYFEGDFQPPFPKMNYVAEKCALGDDDRLPEICPPGFYKIVFKCFGKNQPSWSFTAVFRLKPKLF